MRARACRTECVYSQTTAFHVNLAWWGGGVGEQGQDEGGTKMLLQRQNSCYAHRLIKAVLQGGPRVIRKTVVLIVTPLLYEVCK